MRVKQIAWPDGSMVRLFLGGTVDKRAGSSQEDAESWNSEIVNNAGLLGDMDIKGRRVDEAQSSQQARLGKLER
jgi:hypothetical protein